MTFIAGIAPRDTRVATRIAVAIAALLFAGIVVFGLGALLAGAVPAAPKHPFGVGIREAAPSASGLGRWMLLQQEWFYSRMAEGLRNAREHHGFALGMILVAFGYGVFHAGGPGHGKAVISAYLVANERTLMRGIALSVASALLQALVAIAIVLGATLIIRATAQSMTRLTNWVEIASFAAIALFGLALTWRKAAPIAALLTQAKPGTTTGAPHDRHDHGAHHHGHTHHDPHAHENHAHDEHAHCGHHAPVEFVQSPAFRWRDAVPVVLAAGARPCSGAIIVLVFALSQGLLLAGLAAVFAMALGVAITVSVLATLSIFARRTARRLVGRDGRLALAGLAVELLAAAFVATLGLGLMSGLAVIGAG